MDLWTQVRTHKRAAIGIAVAIVALLALATTALAAGPGARGFAPGGPGGRDGHGFGPRAVVTAVDTTNQTITLGGVPQQIATVKVDQNVKLVAIQTDGTTKDAAFADFKTGSLVEVHFAFNGRGRGSGQGQPGSGQGQPNVTVTELALVPAGQVRVEGLVISTTGGIQIVSGGGLQLTVNTSGTTKVTKGNDTTAAAVTDIKVGDRIVAGGTQSGATVNATTLRIADVNAHGRDGMKHGAGSPPANP